MDTSSILLAGSGCLLLILRDKFIIGSLEFQRKAFGIQYGQREISSGKIFVPIIAIVMIVVSVLNILGIDIDGKIITW